MESPTTRWVGELRFNVLMSNLALTRLGVDVSACKALMRESVINVRPEPPKIGDVQEWLNVRHAKVVVTSDVKHSCIIKVAVDGSSLQPAELVPIIAPLITDDNGVATLEPRVPVRMTEDPTCNQVCSDPTSKT